MSNQRDIVERLNTEPGCSVSLMEEAAAEITRLRAELAAERACRDNLVEVTTDLIAFFGTEKCRPYSVFRDAVKAMAVAVTLGYEGPITLAHADDVHQAAAEIQASKGNG